MAGSWLGAVVLAAAVLQLAQASPVPSQRVEEAKERSRIAQAQVDQAEQRLQQTRDALIKQLIVDVAHDQAIRGAVQAVRVEQELEDELLRAAQAARGNPQKLQQLDQYVRRDKRALGLITGLLGGSGPVNRGPTYSAYIGGGAGGFGLGSKVGLLSSLLGSSSGGLGGSVTNAGITDDSASGTPPGSDSGSILSLVTPLLGSSSGGLGSLSGGGGGGSDDSEGGSSAGAGSDSGSILSLVTPLLGSSSGGGGGGGEGSGDGAAGGGGGSDSSAILGLVTPLLGSSSGGGGGGGDGESSSGGGGGGSDLSSILGISNSGGGGGASVSVGGGGGSNHLTEKLRILTDGVSLLLRVKSLIFRKLFGLLGSSSG